MALTSKATDAEKVVGFIEEMTRDVDAVQGRVLAEILGRNSDAEYLLNYGLGGATDRATFRAKVPMVTYEDMKPYIRRIANGDSSPILSGSGHPISEFLASSGTSGGERKLMPVVGDELDRRQLIYSFLMPVTSRYMPGVDKGNGLYFLFGGSPGTTTPIGLPVRTVLSSYYRSDQFKDRAIDTYHTTCTSPTATILCADVFQSMYAQMVCGLCRRHHVVRVGAVFASCLLRAVQFLQQHWEQLAADIESGVLSPCVSDPRVRQAVAGVLNPDPELAELIRAECSKGDWAGIVTRVWPNAKYLDTIATGAMAQYVPTLSYYGGGLPIASVIYGSSECYFGINLRPLCDDDPSEVSYTIMPNMAYFEFLPLDGDGDASQLVELAHVEAGREYELVVTNYSGLCRYRVGDVLRVAGFHNAAPRFRFVRRQNVVLSVDGDKTTEEELQRAVERASSAMLRPHGGAAVLDYTSRVCCDGIPGHYVVYWELLDLAHKGVAGDVLERSCLEMEEALNALYRQLRVEGGAIGPLEIRVVRPGTFRELTDHAVSRGAPMGQYKVPRCVGAPDMVRLLDDRVVSRHLSPALPHWAPGLPHQLLAPPQG